MEIDSKNNGKKSIIFTVLKIVLFCAVVFGAFFAWCIELLIISFSSVNPVSMGIFTTLTMLSMVVLIFALIFKMAKKVKLISLLATLIFALPLVLIPLYRWYKVERFKPLNDTIDWYSYRPWEKDSKVVVVNAEDVYKISDDLPKIDGAYALYPLYSGVVRALYDRTEYEKDRFEYLMTNGSDVTFENLIDKRVDLIFSAPPSKKQLADAEAKGLKYEITPFAKEAFVFFVHSENPVNDLTSAQIRKIYSGAITEWSQIDRSFKGKIKPFQRNQGSGSQTMLEKIMGDTPIMPPLKEDRLGGMGGIINDVARYRNHKEAVGFTFRYFSTEMFKNGEIKLLAVDGVEPTVENIRNGTYPFIANCCIITVKPRDENIKKIVNFLFSVAGRELIEKTGYVSLADKKSEQK